MVLATVTSPPYTYEWKNLPTGTYSVHARAIDNDGLAVMSAPATISVFPNVAPTVALTAPSQNQQFPSLSDILLSAAASDDGGIARIEFYQGSTLIGTATAPPYSYLWSKVPVGNYVLTAKATDNGGLTTTSAPVNIQVPNSAPVLRGDFKINRQPSWASSSSPISFTC